MDAGAVAGVGEDAAFYAYKQAKEAFVSGYHGTSMFETALVMCIIPVFVLFHHVFYRMLKDLGLVTAARVAIMKDGDSDSDSDSDSDVSGGGTGGGAADKAAIERKVRRGQQQRASTGVKARVGAAYAMLYAFLLDYWFAIFPMIMSLTFVSGGSEASNLNVSLAAWMLACVGVVAALFPVFSGRALLHFNPSDSYISSRLAALNGTRKPFLNDFRGVMMVCVWVHILAVDFPIYPRRFVKTETFGFSPMDAGVGLFIFQTAVVFGKSRGRTEYGARSSRLYYVWTAFKSTLPLVLMGLARLVSVKSLEYQEHVTEYGVHWNFFFTVAAVSLLVGIIKMPTEYTIPFGIIVVAGYQLSLTYAGVQDFILNAPRVDFVTQNREGIMSLYGYLGLFYIAQGLGAFCLRTHSWRGWKITVWLYATITALLFCATFALQHYAGMLPSRRIVNVTYICFVLAIGMFILTAMLAISMLVDARNDILNGVSRNLLFAFLSANLYTGAVNFSIQTIYASPLTSVGTLVLYTGCLSLLHVVLDRYNIVIKI